MQFGSLAKLGDLNGLGVGGTAPFNPKSISGLAAWFDASQQVWTGLGTGVPVDTNTIQQWNDLSGNARHLIQTTAGLRPVYNTGAQNGKPGITFDGISQYMQVAFTLVQPTNVFMVVKTFNGSTVNNYLFDGVTGVGTMGVRFTSTNGQSFQPYAGNADTALIRNPSTPFRVQDVLFNSPAGASTSTFRINNDAFGDVGNVGTSNGGGITLGTAADGTLPGKSQICEVLVYNRALNRTSEAYAVGRYLGSKWGLTMLH